MGCFLSLLRHSKSPFKRCFSRRRPIFFQGPTLRQDFSLPDPIMDYIAKNALSAIAYRKLVKSCKYFFIKRPLIVISCLQESKNGFQTCLIDEKGMEKFDMEKISTKMLWVLGIKSIKCVPVKDCDAPISPVPIKTMISKIYQIEASGIQWKNVSLTFEEVVFLGSQSAKSLHLQNCIVKYENGESVQLETLLAQFPLLEYLLYTCHPGHPDESNVSENTVKEILSNPNLSKMKAFHLLEIPDIFDIDSFYTYLKNIKFIIALTLASDTPQLETKIYTFNTTSICITNILCSLPDLLCDRFGPNYALKGYAFFQKSNENCPMKVLNPFQFANDEQIIYIQSYYDTFDDNPWPKLKNQIIDCKWKFLSAPGYAFKIVIKSFELKSTTQLMVKNTTDILVNQRSAINNHPYYTIDNSLQISFFDVSAKFLAYVSVMKTNSNDVDGNCTIDPIDENDETDYFWKTNSYDSKVYDNNIECKHNIIIKPNTNVLVLTVISIEENVDILSFYTANSNAQEKQIIYDGDTFLFSPNDKEVWFQFNSDDNVQNNGFKLRFAEINCECAGPLIPCGSENFGVMKDSNFFVPCKDVNCSFTIEPCSTSFTFLTILFSCYNDKDCQANNVLSVYTNTSIVFDLKNSTRDTNNIFLYSSNNNTIKMRTFLHSPLMDIYITTTPFEEPQITHRILSHNISQYSLYLEPHQITVFEMSDQLKSQNLSFIVYGTYFKTSEESPLIYNNESLNFNIFNNVNCIIYIHLYKCVFKENKIAALYVPAFEGQIKRNVLSVQLSKGNENCIFEEITYGPKNANVQNSSFSVSAISNHDRECIVHVLPGDFFFITHAWTTSSTENIQIFAGIDESFFLLEFNSTTAEQWKYIGIFSSIYIIKIPKGSTVFLNFENAYYIGANNASNPGLLSVINVEISDFPHHSILSTPYYGALKPFSTFSAFIHYSIHNYPVKFTILYYNMTDNTNFYFEDDDSKTYFINKTTDFIIFKQNVLLKYDYSFDTAKEDGIVFLIESLPNTLNDD